jgi:hypothetical protein
MFTIDCPTHGSRVLVTETRIRDLHNTGQQILVNVECWCGTEVTLRTGRRSGTARVAAQGSNL